MEQVVNEMQKQKLADWGNYPVVEAETVRFDQADQLQSALGEPGEVIAYGNGRSYGDASLQKRVIMTRSFRSFLSFDAGRGVVCCESGALLAELLEAFVPRGWFLPVSPGTKFVTVGGAVAADIHGKNHHVEGSFGAHVLALEVMRADGSVIRCSREEHPEFFALTIGGMGLSGVIMNVTLQLKAIESAWVQQQTIRASRLSELMDAFESDEDWTYSVAWVDTLAGGDALGRGMLMRGEHASAEQVQGRSIWAGASQMKINMPLFLPNGWLNRGTMKAFNSVYYHRNQQPVMDRLVHYESFLYPLDSIGNWNRMYGRRGFMQYQFVLPRATGRGAIEVILKKIQASGLGSFLAVLKLFGEQESFISFPMAGYSLALDFPVCFEVFKLMKELDAMVADWGGRLYLAKDARMDEAMFTKTYPHADDFREAIALLNEGSTRFSSLLSNRLGIT
jgi:FAD/FMN-containing dehydrogenase